MILQIAAIFAGDETDRAAGRGLLGRGCCGGSAAGTQPCGTRRRGCSPVTVTDLPEVPGLAPIVVLYDAHQSGCRPIGIQTVLLLSVRIILFVGVRSIDP